MMGKTVVIPIFALITSCLLIPCVAPASETAQASESLYKLENVVIDPGHGGKDPGCVNRWGLKEKDITLAVALKLKMLIEKEKKFRVYLTREKDEWVSLNDRVKIVNKYPSDRTLIISLHCNMYSSGKVHGLETYLFDLSATDDIASKVAARENDGEKVDTLGFILTDLSHRLCAPYSELASKLIHDQITRKLALRDRSIRKAPFRMLSMTRAPAMLIEMGYLSNAVEQKKLSDPKHQAKFAEAIYEGIKAFAVESTTLYAITGSSDIGDRESN